MHVLGIVVRFVVSALVLMFVGFLVPRFTIGGFWSALLLALFIAVACWIVEGIFGRRVTPFGRGIVGFLMSAIIIWAAQFVIGGMEVSLFGAIVAALVIGIIDLFTPVATPFSGNRREAN